MTHDQLLEHRLGYGPILAPGRGLTGDVDSWIGQLDTSSATRPVTGFPSQRECTQAMRTLQEIREAQRSGEDPVQRVGQMTRDFVYRSAFARYQSASSSNTPLIERLVHFWSNHFAVSIEKNPVGMLVGHYENEAIRPYVAGNFRDLLENAIGHPAMIMYLDNQLSVGPNSRLGQVARKRARRDLGLNENLAREVLELHTLGVNGGYGQSDVTSLAHVLTGWSVGGGNGPLNEGTPGVFLYRDLIHEPGSQTVLGKRYGQDGIGQIHAVLDDLALHPATAKYLAEKLARHFVSDTPPASLVSELAAVYLRHRGELKPVYRALIKSAALTELAWQKLKTPHDFVVSSWRALNLVPNEADMVANSLAVLGQFPFRPGSPAGYPDRAEGWSGANNLMKRVEWAQLLVRRLRPTLSAVDAAVQLFGNHQFGDLHMTLRRAESAEQAWTLLLASPQFQRR